MAALFSQLWNDEAGFLVSSELILVSTILVLSLVVGMSSVSHAVNHELEDLASAFGSVNQSYRYDGLFGNDKGWNSGSGYEDSYDNCDGVDIVSSDYASEY